MASSSVASSSVASSSVSSTAVSSYSPAPRQRPLTTYRYRAGNAKRITSKRGNSAKEPVEISRWHPETRPSPPLLEFPKRAILFAPETFPFPTPLSGIQEINVVPPTPHTPPQQTSSHSPRAGFSSLFSASAQAATPLKDTSPPTSPPKPVSPSRSTDPSIFAPPYHTNPPKQTLKGSSLSLDILWRSPDAQLPRRLKLPRAQRSVSFDENILRGDRYEEADGQTPLLAAESRGSPEDARDEAPEADTKTSTDAAAGSYLLAPFMRLCTYINTRIARRLHDVSAHSGELGSESSETGKWLRRPADEYLWDDYEHHSYKMFSPQRKQPEMPVAKGRCKGGVIEDGDIRVKEETMWAVDEEAAIW